MKIAGYGRKDIRLDFKLLTMRGEINLECVRTRRQNKVVLNYIKGKEVKISPLQAMEAHRVARG
jgi:hypothetical protein